MPAMKKSMLLLCWRAVKALTLVLFPNLGLIADADLKIVLSNKSVVAAAIGQTTEAEPIDDDHVSTITVLFDKDMLTTIPNTIRNVLVQVAVHTDQCKDASCPFSKCTSTCSSSQSAKATYMYMRNVWFFRPRWISSTLLVA